MYIPTGRITGLDSIRYITDEISWSQNGVYIWISDSLHGGVT